MEEWSMAAFSSERASTRALRSLSLCRLTHCFLVFLLYIFFIVVKHTYGTNGRHAEVYKREFITGIGSPS